VNVVGDLERWFAASLYPNRVPIAIALGVLAILAVAVARRRGWFAAARRHPGRTVAAAAMLLALGGPVAWYLGSPLFITTSLQEPAPVAATPRPANGDPAPSGPAAGLLGGVASPGPAAAAAPPSAPPALAASQSGAFTGADSFHFGRGTATLAEIAPGTWSVRFEAFSVRNGPDLYVYLSPSAAGYAAGSIELGRLKATDGSFNMAVPAGSDPESARSVVIWCKQFSVQFAVATLGS
jgi:electron transfer DM13